MTKISIGITLFLMLGLLIFGVGCIGLQSLGTSIIAKTQDGSRYDYEITTTSPDHSTNELENLEIVINQDEPGKKYLSYSFDANGKQLYERSFTAEKTNNDSVIQIDSKIPIIQEIRPELPNLLVLHEGALDPDAHWTKSFNQSGDYVSTNGTIHYNVSGSSDFTNIGNGKITTKAGSFDCTEIQQVISYSMNESLVTPNGTIDSRINGELNGENWINQDNGILVQSSFDSHKMITVDLSDSYNGILGFEKIYREIPVDLNTTTELTQMSAATMGM